MAFETTTDEVIAGVDLAGKIAVVTGATTGLGQETARALAAAGAHVVVCGRTTEKCEASMSAIRDVVPGASLDSQEFDLADLATVRTGADALLARHERIDLLINNAGVMFTPEGKTADGFETQFGTNHLGHFVLTNRLMPALKAAAPSRIVNLSSAGHFTSDVLWDDPHFESTDYDTFVSYGQSKTSNILFSVELDRRHGADGVRANAVHPGMIMTDLARHMGPGDFEELQDRASKRENGPGLPEFKTLEQGAATSVWVAVSDEMEGVGAQYCEDASVSTPAAYAIDADAAERLWTMSEGFVGETFA
ncbi:MAG: SDR family NAD(P)-dependent oxidoreductase [Actinomycetota bacterium]